MRRQQALHFPAQICIVAAGFVQKCRALRSLAELQGFAENVHQVRAHDAWRLRMVS